MNDPKAVELLMAAKKAGACSPRIAPYDAKMAAGTLQMSDIDPKDAVWLLAIVKPADKQDLKTIAGSSPWIGGQ